MPFLQYICLDCEQEVEVRHEIGQEEIACPLCLSIRLKRIYYPVKVIYKGDGFTKGTNGKEKKKE